MARILEKSGKVVEGGFTDSQRRWGRKGFTNSLGKVRKGRFTYNLGLALERKTSASLPEPPS